MNLVKAAGCRKRWLAVLIAGFFLTGFLMSCSSQQAGDTTQLTGELESRSLTEAIASGKPTIAEFGRGTCVPCKAMKPVLQEFDTEYQGKVNVVIVEIDSHRDLTGQYKIMAIPTQIFFDSDGVEVTRHIGFLPKEEIVNEFRKMGIN